MKSEKQWDWECHVGMCMQGSKLFLNLGHAMTNDERWEGETGDLALPRFCPERWLSQAGARTGAWMPFGGGPRMCLGYLLATAEIKVPSFFPALRGPSRPVAFWYHASFGPSTKVVQVLWRMAHYIIAVMHMID